MNSKARTITSNICLAIAVMLFGSSLGIITYQILTEGAPGWGDITLAVVGLLASGPFAYASLVFGGHRAASNSAKQPKPGEYWKPYNDGDPFPPALLACVQEVRDGWVRFEIRGYNSETHTLNFEPSRDGIKQHMKIANFTDMYRDFTEEYQLGQVRELHI